jgi:hypothetical protein
MEYETLLQNSYQTQIQRGGIRTIIQILFGADVLDYITVGILTIFIGVVLFLWIYLSKR